MSIDRKETVLSLLRELEAVITSRDSEELELDVDVVDAIVGDMSDLSEMLTEVEA